jgi:hypothetical protein
LTNPGELFIDPVLYLETEFGKNGIEYEQKLLLMKRFNKILAVINFSSEIVKENNTGVISTAFELTAGVAYDLNENIALDFEFRNDRNYSNYYSSEENQASYVRPTVSLAYG